MKFLKFFVAMAAVAAAGYFGWRYMEDSGFTASSPEDSALLQRAMKLYPDNRSARRDWISHTKTVDNSIRAKCGELKSAEADAVAKLSAEKYPDDPNARLDYFSSQIVAMNAFYGYRSDENISDTEFDAVSAKAAQLYPNDWKKRLDFAALAVSRLAEVRGLAEKIPAAEFKRFHSEFLENFGKSPNAAFEKFFSALKKASDFYEVATNELTDGAREYLLKTGKPIEERASILDGYIKNPSLNISPEIIGKSRFSLSNFGTIAPEIKKTVEKSLYIAKINGSEYVAPLVESNGKRYFVLPIGALFAGASEADFLHENKKITAKIARAGEVFAFYETSSPEASNAVGIADANSSSNTLSLAGTNPFGKTISRHLMPKGLTENSIFFYDEEHPYLLANGALVLDTAADNAVVAIGFRNFVSKPEIGALPDSMIYLKLKSAKRPMYGLRKSLGGYSFAYDSPSAFEYRMLKRGFEKSSEFDAQKYAAEISALRKFAKGNKILLERLVRNDFGGFLDDEVKAALPKVYAAAGKCRGTFLESSAKVAELKFAKWYAMYADIMARAIRSDGNIDLESFDKCLLETAKRELKLRSELAAAFDAVASGRSALTEALHTDLSKNLSSGVYCAKK